MKISEIILLNPIDKSTSIVYSGDCKEEVKQLR